MPLAVERLSVLSAFFTVNLVIPVMHMSYKRKKEGFTMDAERNMQLMQTLDDAWNTQDWDT
ncbi:MAG: hypothetical protein ACXV5D_07015, partial [Halobacteriota archaeon]